MQLQIALLNTAELQIPPSGGVDLANVVKMPPTNINPGNSGLIPEKCTIIEIENISKDVTGSFNVITR